MALKASRALRALKSGLLILALASTPIIGKAQEAEEYPEYWEDSIETEEQTYFTDSVDISQWRPWDFKDFGGGPWKMFNNGNEDIAVRIEKPSLFDTLVDNKYVTFLKVYKLPVTIKSTKGNFTIDPYRDFYLSDGDVTRGINWLEEYGRGFYEKFNKMRLRPDPSNRCPSDMVSIGSMKGIKRVLTFIIARTTVQETSKVPKANLDVFFDPVISLKYGNTTYEIDNLDSYYPGKWYDQIYDVGIDP